MSELVVPPYITRRAEFLLAEARSPDPARDQTVIYALRVISNFTTVGRDFQSAAIKWRNPRLSARAWALYYETSDDEWQRSTINEHPQPLSQVWEWIRENANSIDARQIIERIAEHPMITITKEEDAELTGMGFRSKGSATERYARIEIGEPGPPPRRKPVKVKATDDEFSDD